MIDKDLSSLEQELLIHRFLYYVLLEPILSDYDYDQLERLAKERHGPDSIVHSIGSDNIRDYPLHVIGAAKHLLKRYHDGDRDLKLFWWKDEENV